MKITISILTVTFSLLGVSCRTAGDMSWFRAEATVVSKSEVIDYTWDTHGELSTEILYRITTPEEFAGRTVSYGYSAEDPEIQKLKIGDSVSIEVMTDILDPKK
jgi:hypothetical protein